MAAEWLCRIAALDDRRLLGRALTGDCGLLALADRDYRVVGRIEDERIGIIVVRVG